MSMTAQGQGLAPVVVMGEIVVGVLGVMVVVVGVMVVVVVVGVMGLVMVPSRLCLHRRCLRVMRRPCLYD